MSRGVQFVVTLCAVLSCWSAVAQDPLNSLVRIYTTRASPGTTLGSGAFISADGNILTAYHVIQGATTVEVYGPFLAASHTATLVEYNENRDLAIIHVNVSESKVQYLTLAAVPNNLTKREARAYGCPGGKGGSSVPVSFFRDSIFPASDYPDPKGGPLFRDGTIPLFGINATLDRGMSGGPVILDGKLIGIISGSEVPAATSLGWAIPAAESLPSLKKAGTLTFASVPQLALLKAKERALLLRSSLPTERQENITALREVLIGTPDRIKKWDDAITKALERINSALAISAGTPGTDDRTKILAAAHQGVTLAKLLQTEDKASDATTLALLDEIPKDLDETSRAFDAIFRTTDHIQKELQAAHVSQTASSEEVDKAEAILQRLRLRAYALSAAVETIKRLRPNLQQVLTTVPIAMSNFQQRTQLRTNSTSGLINAGEKLAPEFSGPMPNTIALLIAEQQFLQTEQRFLHGNLADDMSLLQSLDTLIEVYTNPSIVEAAVSY